MPPAPQFAQGGNQGSIVPAASTAAVPGPSADQMQNRTAAANNGGVLPDPTKMTSATDTAGNKVMIGDPSLNPQFNYGSVSPSQQKQPATEPAVISSDGVDSTIAKNNTMADTLAEKGTYVGQDGALRYADGSMVPAPVGAESTDGTTWTAGGRAYGAAPQYLGDTTDPETKQMNDLFASLKSSLDSSTKTQMDAIEQQHQIEMQQQQDANNRAGASRGAALLAGGASRYAPFSASGTTLAQTSYGLQQLQALDAKENAAIATVKKAQDDGNQQLVDKALGDIQDMRTKKQDAAQKIIDAQQMRIQKGLDDKVQQTKDDAVANIMAQGITDPKTILSTLSGQGVIISADEVASAMKNLIASAPPGVSDLVKTLENNGAPADVIQKVLASKNMNDAYAAAGDYASGGGTGIIGEYNYYRAQAKANGQTPVDFSTYQNEDANRKLKATGNASTGDKVLTPSEAAALGVPYGTTQSQAYGKSPGKDTVTSLAQQLVDGNLSPSELSKRATGAVSYNDVLKAADDYSLQTTGKHFDIAQADRDYKFANRPQTQDTLNYMGSLVGSDDGNGNISGGNLDDLVNLSNSITRTTFPSLNDAAAWARYSTGDPKIAQFQATATEVADQVAKILQGGSSGGGTSDAKLQQAVNLFNTGFSKDQLKGVVDAIKPLLSNRAKSMIKDNPYLSDYADQFGVSQKKLTDAGQGLINDEKTAQDAIVAAVKSDPTLKDTVRGLIGGTFKGVDHPLTYVEVQQYLKATGKLK